MNMYIHMYACVYTHLHIDINIQKLQPQQQAQQQQQKPKNATGAQGAEPPVGIGPIEGESNKEQDVTKIDGVKSDALLPGTVEVKAGKLVKQVKAVKAAPVALPAASVPGKIGNGDKSKGANSNNNNNNSNNTSNKAAPVKGPARAAANAGVLVGMEGSSGGGLKPAEDDKQSGRPSKQHVDPPMPPQHAAANASNQNLGHATPRGNMKNNHPRQPPVQQQQPAASQVSQSKFDKFDKMRPVANQARANADRGSAAQINRQQPVETAAHGLGVDHAAMRHSSTTGAVRSGLGGPGGQRGIGMGMLGQNPMPAHPSQNNNFSHMPAGRGSQSGYVRGHSQGGAMMNNTLVNNVDENMAGNNMPSIMGMGAGGMGQMGNMMLSGAAGMNGAAMGQYSNMMGMAPSMMNMGGGMGGGMNMSGGAMGNYQNSHSSHLANHGSQEFYPTYSGGRGRGRGVRGGYGSSYGPGQFSGPGLKHNFQQPPQHHQPQHLQSQHQQQQHLNQQLHQHQQTPLQQQQHHPPPKKRQGITAATATAAEFVPGQVFSVGAGPSLPLLRPNVSTPGVSPPKAAVLSQQVQVAEVPQMGVARANVHGVSGGMTPAALVHTLPIQIPRVPASPLQLAVAALAVSPMKVLVSPKVVGSPLTGGVMGLQMKSSAPLEPLSLPPQTDPSAGARPFASSVGAVVVGAVLPSLTVPEKDGDAVLLATHVPTQSPKLQSQAHSVPAAPFATSPAARAQQTPQQLEQDTSILAPLSSPALHAQTPPIPSPSLAPLVAPGSGVGPSAQFGLLMRQDQLVATREYDLVWGPSHGEALNINGEYSAQDLGEALSIGCRVFWQDIWLF